MPNPTRILMLAGLATMASAPAFAAEGGAGFYLLGTRGTAAGVVPPAGTYLQFDTYVYSAHTSATVPQGGRLDVGLEATAVVPMATVTWVPADVDWGGLRPFLGATLVTGYKSTDISALLTGPGGAQLSRNSSDSDFLLGDPVLAAGLGGGQGPWFWSVSFLLNVPVGDYQSQRNTNIAFNHWGLDSALAVTWMDADSGWEASAAVGLTVNAENPATDYRTGNEAHFEGSVSKTFDSGWAFGLNGYHYQQVSGDSGDGAILGDFKGRVTGLGPSVTYNTTWGDTPVTLKARYFREFDARNRLAGDAFFLTLALPFGF